MLKRLFSTYWISGKFDTLLEQAPFYITGSPNPLMIVSGPTESGKTNLSHNIIAQLVTTGHYSEDYLISTSLNPGDEEDERSPAEQEKSVTEMFLESLLEQTADLLSRVQKQLDVKTKQNILDILITYAKKVSKNWSENQFDDLDPVLEELNKFIRNYPQLPKFKDFSEQQYQDILSHVSIKEGFEVVVTSLFNTHIETTVGSLSCEFLVKILLQVNKFCLESGIPKPILRIDDTHYLYKEESGKDYLKNFVYSLITHKGVSCMLVGNCQFEEVIRLLHQNKDQLAWFHLENFQKESSEELYELFELKIKDSDKDLMWKVVGGNIAAADVVSERLSQHETLENIYKDFLDTGAKSIDSFFTMLEEQQDNLTIKEKIFGAENKTVRAFVHFLTSFLEKPEQELKISIQEFSLNPVLEGLVVYGVMNYNPITEVLKIDKPIISKLIENCQKYQKYSGWLSRSKNREAYDSLISEYADSELKP